MDGPTELSAAPLKAGATAANPDSAMQRLHVFFDTGVERDALAEASAALLAAARHRLGRSDARLEVLKASRIGRSVMVTGDPDVLALLPSLPHVIDVLGTQLEDPYPKPVESRRVW